MKKYYVVSIQYHLDEIGGLLVGALENIHSRIGDVLVVWVTEIKEYRVITRSEMGETLLVPLETEFESLEEAEKLGVVVYQLA